MAIDAEKRRSILEKVYLEHRSQARHIETLRTGALSTLGVATAGLIAVTKDNHVDQQTAGWAILGLGLFGVLLASKLHEKLRLEMVRSDACLAAMFDDDPPEAVVIFAAVSKKHDESYPVLHRFKMRVLWIGLALAICFAGAFLLIKPG
ncbi:hypothetical protein SGCZBJ_14405 [Caulobacter zeae]|uniref:Uncharacterized protein n=1 Tax=Caulobacter zeae TaxID=2055137 RepID=A0A2N5DD95_9CAUL|nr:hypothetical protein [Caulobacter zeae]PLR24022.1 hypothetical protein SGCZBJ_14405 [Caulobacter zeae]